jgi:hypothetical protein
MEIQRLKACTQRPGELQEWCSERRSPQQAQKAVMQGG